MRDVSSERESGGIAEASPAAGPEASPSVMDALTEKSTETLNPARWVEEHGDALFHFAMLHVRDAELAEELVQDTFLSGLAASETFEGRASERSWLTSILKHKIIDHIRKSARRGRYHDERVEDADLDRFFDATGHWAEGFAPKRWQRDPLDALQQKSFLQALEGCIGGLPERLGMAFTLRELDELESERICEILDVTPNNLWVILHRARMKLRSCIESRWLD